MKSQFSFKPRRVGHVHHGLTLVEVLVVIGIIAVLIGILIPAVQAAREAVRASVCRNHLRQIALASANFEATFQQYPGGGWGFRWIGDPDRSPSNNQQPGGWVYSVLPFADASSTYNLASGLPAESRNQALELMLRTPLGIFSCPSRRPPTDLSYGGQFSIRNGPTPVSAFKTDYAGNGGDNPHINGPGPTSDSPSSISAHEWPSSAQTTGIFFAGSFTRAASITDGSTNTYLVGEKYVRGGSNASDLGRDFGDDQSAYIGDDRDIRRWTNRLPARDLVEMNAWDSFGSSHASHWNVVMVDGSVHSLTYSIDLAIHASLGNRKDGSTVAIPK